MLKKTKGILEDTQKTKDWWTLLKDIPVHGNEIKPKKNSMIRVYFENIDGFRVKPRGPVHNNNDKVKYYNTMTTTGSYIKVTPWKHIPTYRKEDKQRAPHPIGSTHVGRSEIYDRRLLACG